MTPKEAAERIRALADDAAYQLYEPGGPPGVPVRSNFETATEAATIVVDFVIDKLPDLEEHIHAVRQAFLADSEIATMAKSASDLAAGILDALANLVEERLAPRDEQTHPTSAEPNTVTVADAKRRAAIALFASIEAAAKAPDNSVSALYDLANGFQSVSDSMLPDAALVTAQIGTPIEAPSSTQFAAFEWFFQSVKNDLGIGDKPQRCSTWVEEVGYVLGLLRAKKNATDGDLLSAKADLDRQQIELGRLRRSLDDVFKAAGDGQVTDMNCMVQARVAALAKSNKVIHDLLDMLGAPSGPTLERLQGAIASIQLDSKVFSSRDWHAHLAAVLDDLDAYVAKARAAAKLQPVATVIVSDVDAARKVFPKETDLSRLDHHAYRIAALRELAAMAGAEPNLRNELQAANEEIKSLRAMNSGFDTIIAEEHAKFGLAPRGWLDAKESINLTTRFATANHEDRAKQAARIALVRQMAETGLHDRAIVKEARAALAEHGFADDELTVDRIHRMADALVKTHAEIATVKKWLDEEQRLRNDFADRVHSAYRRVFERNEFPLATRADHEHTAKVTPKASPVVRDRHARHCALIRGLLAESINRGELLNEARGKLEPIRDRLAKDGFISDDLPGLVETALESLAEAQKHRDEYAKDLESVEQVLDKHKIADVTTAIHALLAARAKILAMTDMLNGKGNDLEDPDLLKLASLIELEAERHAELNSVDTLLQENRKWTTYKFEVNTHGRRMDVIKSLAARAEALSTVQDALESTSIDPLTHPANAVHILAEQRNEAQAELTHISGRLHKACSTWTKLDTPIVTKQDRHVAIDVLAAHAATLHHSTNASQNVDAEKIVQERDALRSDMDKIIASANAITAKDTYVQSLNAVYGAIRAAEARLAGKSSRTTVQTPPPEVWGLVMDGLVELSDFWRRSSDSSWIAAAAGIERMLKKALGGLYWLMLADARERLAKGTNEIGAVVEVTREAIPAERILALDALAMSPDWKPDASISIAMSEGHTTSQDAIDEAKARAVEKSTQSPVVTSPGATRLGLPVFGKGKF
jgi:hypothetical protein